MCGAGTALAVSAPGCRCSAATILGSAGRRCGHGPVTHTTLKVPGFRNTHQSVEREPMTDLSDTTARGVLRSVARALALAGSWGLAWGQKSASPAMSVDHHVQP